MARYAVINNGIVSSVVICDDVDVLPLIAGGADAIIEETEATGVAVPDVEFVDGKFMPIKPFDSWSFDKKSWTWKPPIAEPNDGKLHSWSEPEQTWLVVELLDLPTDEVASTSIE